MKLSQARERRFCSFFPFDRLVVDSWIQIDDSHGLMVNCFRVAVAVMPVRSRGFSEKSSTRRRSTPRGVPELIRECRGSPAPRSGERCYVRPAHRNPGQAVVGEPNRSATLIVRGSSEVVGPNPAFIWHLHALAWPGNMTPSVVPLSWYIGRLESLGRRRTCDFDPEHEPAWPCKHLG